MRRRLGIEILGDHIRDQDEKLEREGIDRPAIMPDLTSSKLLTSKILAKPPTLAPTPTTVTEAKDTARRLYSKYKPDYSNHVLSVTTKI